MKNTIIVLALVAAAYFLLKPRKTAEGEPKESLFKDLFGGVYEGSMLSALVSGDSSSSTSDGRYGSDSDGSTSRTGGETTLRTTTNTTSTSTATTGSGRRSFTRSLNNKNPFL